MVKKVVLALFLSVNILFSQEMNNALEKPSLSCNILEDEDSIMCRFEFPQIQNRQKIQLQWFSPTGELSRQREITVTDDFGAVYDYRYISGRQKGTWIFRVIFKGISYSTTFELK